MRKFPWRKIVLSLLILALVTGSSACQTASGVWDELSTFPHRVEQAVINLFSSIGSVGTALVESIRNTVGGMMGGK